MRRKFCSGSKWMSEAARSTASARSAEISRTTGCAYSSLLACKPQLDFVLPAQLRANLVERDDVVRVRDRENQAPALLVERDREEVVPLGELARDDADRARIDDDLPEIHRLQPELLGERIAQRRLGDEAELHEELADRLARLQLLEQRDPQLILGEDSLRDQNLTDVPLGLRGCRGIHRTGDARQRVSSRILASTWALLNPTARFPASVSARR